MLKRRIRGQEGIALVSVLLFSVLLLSLMGVTTTIALNSQKNVVRQFAKHGQANNIAQAGLQDGLAWFKRQGSVVKWQSSDLTTYPCEDSAFFPEENSTTPELGDTYDEGVGLVRDLNLKGKTWGRYILKRQNCSAPSDGAVRDITFLRGKNEGDTNTGQGLVWYLESEGIIYTRNDLSKGPDQAPNKVITKAKAAIEITRLSLDVPKSPVTIFGTTQSQFNNKCQVLGDDSATYGIHRNTTTPNISGTPAYTIPTPISFNYQLTDTTEDKSLKSVFGSDKAELKALSDKVYTNINDLPDKPQPLSMIFLEGDYTFTAAQKLVGSGVLIVDGNLTLNKDSNSSYSGLIFVTGTLTIKDSNMLGGAIVAQKVVCTPGNSSTLEYNENLMNNVRARIGGYRKNNLTFVRNK